jgi:hypothetical protein
MFKNSGSGLSLSEGRDVSADKEGFRAVSSREGGRLGKKTRDGNLADENQRCKSYR